MSKVFLKPLILIGLFALSSCKSTPPESKPSNDSPDQKPAATLDEGMNPPNGWGQGKIGFIYNNDLFAYLEPCGCRVDPIGGFYRRWNATQSIPKENRFSVDAGNLFYVGTTPPESVRAVWQKQAEAILESYNALSWDAFTPGENDFAFGVENLKKLEKKATFSFLSANLYDKKSGKLLFPPSKIFSRAGLKVGVFGLFSPRFTLPESVEARDPIEAARKAVEQLRANGAEIIVLLSHQGLDQDEALASAVPGIDLIVGASTQSFLQSPRAAGGAKIVQLSSKGQVFGLAVLERAPNSSASTLSLSKVVDLDARFDSIPKDGAPNPMKGIISRMNLEISEMNRKQSDELWNQQASRQPIFTTQVSCTSCHSEQSKFQAKHQHSAAFFTLTARGKEKSLDCLSCHSVGLGAEGGFTGLGDAIVDKNGKYLSYQDILKAAGLDRLPADLSYKKTPKLAQEHAERWNQALTKAKVKHSFVNVQCESCHGPRPGHPFNNAGSSQLSKVKAVSCLQCHTSQQMPSWYGKDGKPLEPIVKAAMKKLACPSMQ